MHRDWEFLLRDQRRPITSIDFGAKSLINVDVFHAPEAICPRPLERTRNHYLISCASELLVDDAWRLKSVVVLKRWPFCAGS